jgi:hypothetical protein
MPVAPVKMGHWAEYESESGAFGGAKPEYESESGAFGGAKPKYESESGTFGGAKPKYESESGAFTPSGALCQLGHLVGSLTSGR